MMCGSQIRDIGCQRVKNGTLTPCRSHKPDHHTGSGTKIAAFLLLTTLQS